MFSHPVRSLVGVLFLAALALLLSAGQAQAQFRGRLQQLNALPSANGSAQTRCPHAGASQTPALTTTNPTTAGTSQAALQQLQTGLWTALQQTNAALTALQEYGSTDQSTMEAALQQRQATLLAALQYTSALRAAAARQSAQATQLRARGPLSRR